MKRDLVDSLLQLAFLEGLISTRGLYEKSAADRPIKAHASSGFSERVQDMLERALAREAEKKSGPMSIGRFLREARNEIALKADEISVRLGIRPNIYRMLENDRISPLKLPVESWKKFRDLFGISPEVLGQMIRRTHVLVLYRPSFSSTLARYNGRKKPGSRVAELLRAAEELFLRADLRLPSSDEAKLNALLDQLRDEA